MSDKTYPKADLPTNDAAKLIEAAAALENKAADDTKRQIELEKDKRREDWANTTKWGVTVAIALTAMVILVIGSLTYQVHSFNGELRNIRDRE